METLKEVIWLVAHYPERPEMDERIRVAHELHLKTGAPIWVFASSSARYPTSVEKCILEKLLALNISRESVCLSEQFGEFECLDTVQEIENVHQVAERESIQKVFCVSNKLQLLQIQALSRGRKTELEYISSKLIETGLWYVGARVFLLPFALLKIGRNFPPLQFVRFARNQWAKWPL